jgi:uncharacterized membrane protein
MTAVHAPRSRQATESKRAAWWAIALSLIAIALAGLINLVASLPRHVLEQITNTKMVQLQYYLLFAGLFGWLMVLTLALAGMVVGISALRGRHRIVAISAIVLGAIPPLWVAVFFVMVLQAARRY